MYNSKEIREINENIFDKMIKTKRENKNEQTINNMIEQANNIADTKTKAHDTDASQINRGRSARIADDRDNKLFETKQYEKIMHSIESEGFYAYEITENDDEVVFDETYNLSQKDEDDIRELNRSFFFPTPKTKRQVRFVGDRTPMCIVKIKYIGGVRLARPLLCLLDTGASCTMIQRRSLPYGSVPRRSLKKQMTTTANGMFDSSESISLEHITLPEFVNGRVVDGIQDARLFDSPNCKYDIIFGRDFLRKTEMKFNFDTMTVEWFGARIEMKETNYHQMMFGDNDMRDIGTQQGDGLFLYWLEQMNLMIEEEAFDSNLQDENFAGMKSRAYGEVTTKQVIEHQNHLNEEEKFKLKTVLDKHTVLFDGKLGCYPHEKFHINLLPNTKPCWQRPFPIPYRHERVYREEVDSMIDDGILRRRQTGSKWNSPSFCTPKKDLRVRIVTDFRELNKYVVRDQYPMPHIRDVMQNRSEYDYCTKIDLSMMFYCFMLDEESKALTVTSHPDGGLLEYNRLPMGLRCSPDIAQATIEKVLAGLGIVVYIDDIGIWTKGSIDEHFAKVCMCLSALANNGLKANPLKCEWAVQNTDFLGYDMTPKHCKPMKNKIDALLLMDRPRNKKQVRSFVGGVNFYKTMWPRRTHVLAPLTSLQGKDTPFVWGKAQQQAFDEMKALLAHDCLNVYPDLNQPFDIYTDASDYQLGAAIIQNGRPIAYYSRTLLPGEKNYTTTEKELLAIVLTLKEYRQMLIGAKLNVYTDHKNLTFRTMSMQRILRWRLYLENFDINLQYIEGNKNVLADCFSRLPRMSKPSVGDKEIYMKKNNKGTAVDWHLLKVPEINDDIDELCLTITAIGDDDFRNESKEQYNYNNDEPNLFNGLCDNTEDDTVECLINLPSYQNLINPLTMQNIYNHQSHDLALMNDTVNRPEVYQIRTINQIGVICVRANVTQAIRNWKIFLPDSLANDAVRWYHLVLGHCGTTRLYDSIRARFYHPRLSVICKEYQCPDNCWRHKFNGRGIGHLAAREANAAPWQEIAVDLIGPWKITINETELTFKALTIIDPVTNLIEIVRINNKTSENIAQQLSNVWLSRYPWPSRCIHDNGGEFIGHEFQNLLVQTGVESKPTTVKNPMSNGIVERSHKTISDTLRVLLHVNPPTNENDVNNMIDNALASCMHAMRCSINHTMETSPGAMVFNRDMLINVPLLSNLIAIKDRRQQVIDNNLMRTNKKRVDHNYSIGDRVMIVTYDPNKLDSKQHGPYRIVRVFTNGTVRVQLRQHIQETFNIRKVFPYRGP